MKILVLAVNNREELLDGLPPSLPMFGGKAARGNWSEVQATTAPNGGLVLLTTFWDRTADLTAWIQSVDRNVPLLFLLDDTVMEPGEGIQALAGLLAENLAGRWWCGAILSGAPPGRLDRELRSSAKQYGATSESLSEHYLGCAQAWRQESLSLIAQLNQRTVAGDTLSGWKPSLRSVKHDRLRSAAHFLANLALPIDCDIEALQGSPMDAKLVAAIVNDHLAAETGYLTRLDDAVGDVSAAPMGLVAVLDGERDRLCDLVLDSTVSQQIRDQFADVIVEVENIRSSAGSMRVDRAELVAGLRRMSVALHKAEQRMRQMAASSETERS